jgi:hypothetical protein
VVFVVVFDCVDAVWAAVVPAHRTSDAIAKTNDLTFLTSVLTLTITKN